MQRIVWFLILTCGSVVASGQSLDLRQGERIVFVGGTLIEREQRDGYWELMLTARFPDRSITFRNLGWSGDTVWGEARAGFDPPAAGQQRLIDQVIEAKPTLIVIGFGRNESFAGAERLARFTDGVKHLLTAWKPLKARIIFLAPLRQEKHPSPLPDPEPINARLWHYISELHEIATNEDHGWLDLEPWLRRHREEDEPLLLTDNGVHLTKLGYWITAAMIENEFQFTPSGWQVSLAADGRVVDRRGTKVEQVKRLAEGCSFQLTSDVLPVTAPTRYPGRSGQLTFRDLPEGRYQLKIDGDPIITAAHDEWAAGVALDDPHEWRQIEQLRRTIVEKNELFFHRWRPQNITYLFGFRKHEQGNNAQEIPQFDPLIAAREQTIAELRSPRPHHFELKRIP